MPALKSKLSHLQKHMPKVPKEPVWKGPAIDGVTQSLIGAFITCRERFRLRVIKGLRPAPQFNSRLHYGNMWHCAEEHINNNWEKELEKYVKTLLNEFRYQQDQVIHWYNVCKVQFPIYLDFWAKHKDVKTRKIIFAEKVFAVPYELPSGRTVLLKGKFDSVDVIGVKKEAAIYLQENKSKSEIDTVKLKRQLGFDLQTMLYLIALRESRKITATRGLYDLAGALNLQVAGVRYNVIRRPLSGGAGSIRQHKPTKSNPEGESSEAFYARLAGLIKDAPETYFARWKSEVSAQDMEKYEKMFLIPVLESLCDWYEFITACPDCDPWKLYKQSTILPNHIHYMMPHGVYNPMLEGGFSDIDNYIETESDTGLVYTDNLFPELT